jgi:RNA polymerase sigma-70 factor (sigma-E family)
MDRDQSGHGQPPKGPHSVADTQNVNTQNVDTENVDTVTSAVLPSAALPALYDQHFRSLVKLASIYVDTRESAEEVVQDAFVKLLSGNYRIEAGREASYLRMMVLNGARSTLRKRRVRRLHTPDAPGLVAAAEESGVASSERDRILNAVRKLSEKQASVIILRYYLDLSEAEIAETLGMARGSVKSHAHRGLAKLESMLGEGGFQ